MKPGIGGKDAAIVPIAHEVTTDHGTELLNGVILRNHILMIIGTFSSDLPFSEEDNTPSRP